MKYRRNRDVGLLAQLVRLLGPRALVMWVLLMVVGFSMSAGLTEVVEDLDGVFVFSVTSIALTVGWILGMAPGPVGMAAVLGTLFGLEYLLIRVGRLGDTLLRLVRAFGTVSRELISWYWTEQPPNWTLIPQIYVELWTDMATLLNRTGTWLASLVSGGDAFDVVGIALTWGFGIWLYSFWYGMITRRYYRPVLGVLPGGLLLAFVLSYTNSNPYVLLPILGVSLVLLALMRQTAREDRWSFIGVDFSQGLWSDIALVATGLSIALVVAAAIAPSISAQKIADWVREVTDRDEPTRTEQVAEGLGLEQKPVPRPVRPLEAVRSTGLPRRHLIGSGPELSRVVVMIIETGELPPVPEAVMDETVPRHYWRSITYDRYFGRGWATSGTEDVEYEAGEIAVDPEVPHARVLRQTVRYAGPSAAGLIHVDGTLVSVDQDYEVSWRPPGEIFAATTRVSEYRADSLIPVVTEEGLREVSTEYPDWIRERYLQLPASLPERVTALARDLTATEPTPYDRALAIESYLRQFPYNLDVPTSGTTSDIADYFLFELQEGYCDYYATAMVVLARASGLPARLVVGYINGSYDPLNARYIVTEADAHAWPEIYFPGYGWVEFEPTGGRPPIQRPSASGDDPIVWPEGMGPDPLVSDRRSGGPQIVFGLWVSAVVGTVLLAVGLYTVADSARLMLSSAEDMVRTLRKRLRKHAERLRIPIRQGDTAYELAQAYEDQLSAMAKPRGEFGTDQLDLAVLEVRDLMDFYVKVWYSPDSEVTRRVRWEMTWMWWRLRWRLLLARLWRGSLRAPEELPLPRSAPGTASS
ncbi:MAG: transglutaminase-like domain-containing protein [Anaerolineae bacterium]